MTSKLRTLSAAFITAISITAMAVLGAEPTPPSAPLPNPLLINLAPVAKAALDPVANDGEIVVGQSAPFTGPAAELGKQLRKGANAYFASINAQGGVNGRKIRLISLDDGYEPTKAASNTRDLVERKKVFALLGYVGTSTSNAALPIFTEQHVPFIAPLTGATSMRVPFNSEIFNLRASYEDETRAIVNYLVSTMMNKRIAVMYQNDAYGESGLAGITKAMKSLNVEIVAKATVDRNSVDVSKAVATLAAANPQSVIVISAYKSSAAFIKAMRAQRAVPQFWNVSFVGSTSLSEELSVGDELGIGGAGVGISQVVPFPWLPLMPAAIEHRKQVGDAVSFNSFEGYFAAKIFVEGLKRAGKNPTRESFVKGLEEAGRLDLGGYFVQFSPTDHNGSKFVDLTMITRNGKFIH